jgi:hypothetical protein
VWAPGTPQLDLALDGIEELWLDGPPEEASEILEKTGTVGYRRHLRTIVSAMCTYVFDGTRVANVLPERATGQGMLKRLVPLVRTKGWSHEQFIRHWVDVHAELLKKLPHGPRRYDQLYVHAEIPPPARIVALDVHVDGFSESWFADEAEMTGDSNTQETRRPLHITKSISLNRSSFSLTKLNIMLGRQSRETEGRYHLDKHVW